MSLVAARAASSCACRLLRTTDLCSSWSDSPCLVLASLLLLLLLLLLLAGATPRNE